MRVNNRTIILLFVAITLLLFPVAAFTTGAVRIILGLPVAFFIPGYMLLSALFPHKDSLSPVARITYSLGLSAAFNIITGAVLNFTPWGIEMLPILTVAALFIGINAAIAWRRSRQTDEELDFTVDIDLYRWRQTAGVAAGLVGVSSYLDLSQAPLITLSYDRHPHEQIWSSGVV